MKKQLIFISIATLMGISFTACKGDDDSEIKYANFTVEQNKENIESEGLEVVSKLEDMKGISAIQVVMILDSLLNQPGSGPALSPATRILAPIAGMNKSLMGLATLRSTNPDISSLGGLLEEMGGVYTYNSTVDTFAYVHNSNEITFYFPIGDSFTNNGRITLNNYTSQLSTNSDFEGTLEQPKSLDINIWNGNSKLFSMEMDASYNNDDIPSYEKTTITFLEGYSFSQELTNNQNELQWKFAFALDGDKFFNGEFNTKGNYSYDNLSADRDGSIGDIAQILSSANAFVQLGNIKMAGSLDFRKIAEEFNRRYSENEDGPETEAEMEAICAILNNYIKVVLVYANDNTAIAKSNITFYEKTDMSFDGNQYVYDTYYNPDMQFIFADQSAIDDSFFSDGFDELKTALETFLSEMNVNYRGNVQ
ncbi:MAG: hypothetical protein PHS30_07830 [Bacteroidales bacterium]|nr:hypothetical protein [Bacteroidales bacterium]